MAKKREPTQREEQARSNSKVRGEIMRECARDVRDIQKQRKELNQEMSTIRERLDQAGIDKKAFEHALRLVDMQDAAARDNYLDDFQEAFASLGGGDTLDWIKALDKSVDDAKAGEAEAEKTEKKANSGRRRAVPKKKAAAKGKDGGKAQAGAPAA